MTPVHMAAPQLRGTTSNGMHCVVDVGLIWYPTAPHTIEMIVCQRGSVPVKWMLDRETFAAGIDAPAGIGDWSMFPDLARREQLAVEMVFVNSANTPRNQGNHEGMNLMISLLRVPIQAFLRKTYEAVPADAAFECDPTTLIPDGEN